MKCYAVIEEDGVESWVEIPWTVAELLIELMEPHPKGRLRIERRDENVQLN